MATLIKETAQFEGNEDHLISAICCCGSPTSLLLLSSPCQTFEIPGVTGLIGYQLAQNCAVVLGDPLCPPNNIPKLTETFHAYCRNKGYSVVYLLVSHSFAQSSIHQTCQTLLQVGDQLTLDPTQFKMKQKLRWKVHQSMHHGVMIQEYTHFNPTIENQLKETMKTWLKGKQGPQIYLGTLDLFEKYENRRIFFAEQDGKVIGIAIILYLASQNGWVITSLLALPEAPVGVTEHLMSQIFTTMTDEDCHFLCLGFVASGVGEMTGISPFSQMLIQWTYRVLSWVFHLDAKKTYFNKYHPNYSPTYILCADKLGINELLSIKKILNVRL